MPQHTSVNFERFTDSVESSSNQNANPDVDKSSRLCMAALLIFVHVLGFVAFLFITKQLGSDTTVENKLYKNPGI